MLHQTLPQPPQGHGEMERAKDFVFPTQPSPHISGTGAVVNPSPGSRPELIWPCQRLPVFSGRIYHCYQDQESTFPPPQTNLVSCKLLSWAVGSLGAPACFPPAPGCAKRLCRSKRSLCTASPPSPAARRGSPSLRTVGALGSRLPLPLLALPFLRSCLLPESGGKRERENMVTKSEKHSRVQPTRAGCAEPTEHQVLHAFC